MELLGIYHRLGNGVASPPRGEDLAVRLREDGADVLVADSLRPEDLEEWPAGDRDTLERRRRNAMALELVETSVLLGVLDAFDAAGIPSLLLKGAALARTHYERSWTRLRSDIDMLVPQVLLPAAEQALIRIGWRPTLEPVSADASGQRHFLHENAAAPPLDLHVRLLAPVLYGAPEFDDLWRCRQSIAGLSRGAFTLADADALWYGCAHLALHHTGEARTLWLFDLDRLARSLTDEGWRKVDRWAVATSTRTMCAGILETTADLFATPLPEDLLRSWKTATNEHAHRYLSVSSELHIQWLNLRAARGWRARATLARAHLLPDAAYMRARYGVTSKIGLTGAYAARVVGGGIRWLWYALTERR